MSIANLLPLGLCCCTLAGLTRSARADDVNAPVWRGQTGATFQEWELAANSATPAPDLVSNPFGNPTLTIDHDPPVGTGWYDTLPAVYGAQQGFWDIGTGSMTVAVPNSPDAGLYELIQIQVTYWRDFSAAPAISFSPIGTQVGSTTTTLLQDPPGPGAWYSDLSLWQVTPSPNELLIALTGLANRGAIIDELVIDTTFAPVPEPSVASLIALGFWVMARRGCLFRPRRPQTGF